MSEHDKPCARAICTPIGNTNAAQDESNTCCKQQLVPSCMWHDVLLLVLPQVQHEHAHGDVDGRTEPTVGARRKLPFANALADFHQTKCSQVISALARAMEPTAASDGHPIQNHESTLIHPADNIQGGDSSNGVDTFL